MVNRTKSRHIHVCVWFIFQWTEVDRQTCLRSLVSVGFLGRFGNCFMEWASALGFARRLNRELPNDEKRVVALPAGMLTTLQSVLDGVEAITLRDFLTRRNVTLHTGTETTCIEAFGDPDKISSQRTPEAEDYFFKPQRLAGNKSVVLKVYSEFAPAVSSIAEDLRSHIKFKKKFDKAAKERIRDLVNQTRTEFGNLQDQVVVVGVHVRRTDYAHHLKVLYSKKMLDPDYFVRALRWMLWILRSQNSSSLDNRARNESAPATVVTAPPPRRELPDMPLIAVAIVSDDMPWVTSSLIPALHKYISEEQVRSVKVFPAGSEDPFVDLALLSSCNHTIICYGTYGATGALLAGGRTVAYKLSLQGIISESMANFLPNWVLME